MQFKQQFVMAIILLLTSTYSSAMIINGSMNHPTANTAVFNHLAPTSWQPAGGTPDVFDANTTIIGLSWISSSDGGTFAHALSATTNGGSNEGISQSITGLSIGDMYEVTFEQSTSSSQAGHWDVIFGSETLLATSLTSADNNTWQGESLLFTATASTQLLTFRASVEAAGRVDLGVDGVSLRNLSNVPVPAAIWLFGSGLLGLVGVARRQKSQVSGLTKEMNSLNTL